MSLRARLGMAVAVVVVVLVVVVAAVTKSQENFLVEQLDTSLISSGAAVIEPVAVAPTDDTSEVEPTLDLPSSLPEDGEEVRVLDIYLRWDNADGTFVEAVAPNLDDTPDLSQLIDDGSGRSTFQTVDGLESDRRFRVYTLYQPFGLRIVTATPLDDVDAAIDRLRWSLVGGSLVILTILVLSVAWVSRLGIRPITDIASAARAIGRGDRGRRVALYNPRTEAGQLAVAFNEMLDQRDEAETRLRRFVADASHELRTPLTSISGYLDLIADGVFDEKKMNDVIRRLRTESQRMCDLVEDLLLLAHLDEGRAIRSEPVDIAAILLDVASDAAVTHPHRRVEVTIGDMPVRPVVVDGGSDHGDGDGDGEARPTVFTTGDDFRLRQVVAGLVQNALVHTPPAATISMRARRAGNDVVITVADDGPGLDAEAAASVFDRFSRADSSRSRRSTGGGFGLGLAIAQAIAHSHGAAISLDTAPGRGCTFTVTMPDRPPVADEVTVGEL